MITSVNKITLGASPSIFDSGERKVIFSRTNNGSTVEIDGSYDGEVWDSLTDHTAAADVTAAVSSQHQFFRLTGTAGTVVTLISRDSRFS